MQSAKRKAVESLRDGVLTDSSASLGMTLIVPYLRSLWLKNQRKAVKSAFLGSVGGRKNN